MILLVKANCDGYETHEEEKLTLTMFIEGAEFSACSIKVIGELDEDKGLPEYI